jgi:hypothetical protein
MIVMPESTFTSPWLDDDDLQQALRHKSGSGLAHVASRSPSIVAACRARPNASRVRLPPTGWRSAPMW